MIILHVDSSILGSGSASRQISAEILAAETSRNPGAMVRTLDLGVTPIAHMTGAHLAAAQGIAPEEPGLAEDIAAGHAALAGFLEADLVIVGAPMYNFGIPSQLKAWIDRLAIAGQTFRYTADGPEGLGGGKRVVIASARGGFYGPGAPSAAFDHQESYLTAVFAFFGITDIQIVRAEGLALGPDAREAALATASKATGELA